MSRSYRKYPIVIQEKNDAWYSNRVLRRAKLKEFSNGSSYKKYKQNGINWKYYYSIKDAEDAYKKNIYLQKRFKTLKNYLIYYKKRTLIK